MELSPPVPLSLSSNPLLAVAPAAVAPVSRSGIALAEREMLSRPHLAADRRAGVRHKADVRDARQAKSAAEALGELPGPDEAVHVVISGRYSLWDCVPAILDAGTRTIDMLHVATLGFSRRNVEAMARFLDRGMIRRLRLLCSHYFKGTSPHLYEFAAVELAKRPGAEFLSVRTHAKLLLIEFAGGRVLTLESSANLWSCKNIEQLSVFGSRKLHAFHAAWIDKLFHEGREHVIAKEAEGSAGAGGGDGAGEARPGRPGVQVGSRRPERNRHPGRDGAALPGR